jgi:hypothetical protein
LPAAGALKHIVAHASEGQAEIEARLKQIFQQRSSEWAVLRFAILRGRT